MVTGWTVTMVMGGDDDGDDGDGMVMTGAGWVRVTTTMMVVGGGDG